MSLCNEDIVLTVKKTEIGVYKGWTIITTKQIIKVLISDLESSSTEEYGLGMGRGELIGKELIRVSSTKKEGYPIYVTLTLRDTRSGDVDTIPIMAWSNDKTKKHDYYIKWRGYEFEGEF